jgi:hypothetical protein
MSLWSEGAARAAPFASPGKGLSHLEAVEQLKEWTRQRFALVDADAIVVVEAQADLPGFPPKETAVAFWSEGIRHHFRIFKPVEAIAEEDLPPPWLKASLAASDGVACYCC